MLATSNVKLAPVVSTWPSDCCCNIITKGWAPLMFQEYIQLKYVKEYVNASVFSTLTFQTPLLRNYLESSKSMEQSHFLKSWYLLIWSRNSPLPMKSEGSVPYLQEWIRHWPLFWARWIQLTSSRPIYLI